MNVPNSWLVMRLSALGDVVLTTGVLSYLHKKYGWRFTFLTLEPWASVLEGHPAIDSIISIDKKQLRSSSGYSFFKQLAEDNEGKGLLDLHGTMRSRFLALCWKGAVRRYPKFSLQRRLFLQTEGKLGGEKLLRFNVPQRYALAVEEEAPSRLELLPQIFLSEEEKQYGLNMCKRIAGEKPIVALHPFSTHPNKAWFNDNWRDLTAKLADAGVHVVVLGVGNSPVAENANVTDLTGKTTIRETCAVLACSQVLVTGDSGPMHLAGGVQTPVVALFGPTHRAWGFYPEGLSDIVLEADEDCRPCSLHGKKVCEKDQACMRAITPDRVLQSVLSLLM
ncbi:glycosyltransferase family 9 protein [Halodesulfovibrio marinisediminis]|uniref:ADP-heptose:LPS heptosyltransferase n=1 Tax=Halodesulfovibrio marinisediminis DSM 17456 TaxID=1121457 RepID=A0A1N6DRM9_9BACT|nr:glycosyltransferase family 9 protein [Halodesulfovibrio marinisediminis]SIN73436.1 ADP-heptose:LPS heptosyltransferase [Halodesulfovibrio marinisediminis DSM 17456]